MAEAANSTGIRLLSVREFAERTSLSQWTVRRHVSAGRIKHARCGVRILIPDTEIERIAETGLPSLAAAEQNAGGTYANNSQRYRPATQV